MTPEIIGSALVAVVLAAHYTSMMQLTWVGRVVFFFGIGVWWLGAVGIGYELGMLEGIEIAECPK